MSQLITLGKSGRLVIPTQFRKALGLKVGEGVMIALKDDHIEISPIATPVKHVQERVSKYLKPDDDLVDILFKQRKEESSDEHWLHLNCSHNFNGFKIENRKDFNFPQTQQA